MKRCNMPINCNQHVSVPILSDNPRQVQHVLEHLKATKKEANFEELEAAIAFVSDYLKEKLQEEENHMAIPEEDVLVLVVAPGKNPELRGENESFEEFPFYAEYCCVEPLKNADLMMEYDRRYVLKLGQENYLIGKAVVYACDEWGNTIDIDPEQASMVQILLNQKTVMLHDGEISFPAYHL